MKVETKILNNSVVVVSDNGKSMTLSEKDLDEIFNQFYNGFGYVSNTDLENMYQDSLKNASVDQEVMVCQGVSDV